MCQLGLVAQGLGTYALLIDDAPRADFLDAARLSRSTFGDRCSVDRFGTLRRRGDTSSRREAVPRAAATPSPPAGEPLDAACVRGARDQFGRLFSSSAMFAGRAVADCDPRIREACAMLRPMDSG